MKLTPKIYARALWDAICATPETHHDKLVKRFGERLARERRVAWGKAITQELQLLAQKEQGGGAVLETARPVPQELVRMLAHTAHTPAVLTRINPSLLAGAVVRMGDVRVDGSLSRQLLRLAEVMRH